MKNPPMPAIAMDALTGRPHREHIIEQAITLALPSRGAAEGIGESVSAGFFRIHRRRIPVPLHLNAAMGRERRVADHWKKRMDRYLHAGHRHGLSGASPRCLGTATLLLLLLLHRCSLIQQGIKRWSCISRA